MGCAATGAKSIGAEAPPTKTTFHMATPRSTHSARLTVKLPNTGVCFCPSNSRVR
ncbi:DUF6053 domain-containing protein [Lysobacter gummosus]|uniref:DUF6053 domain-containing protein n=1 Tax=Lysobacter TaxID=68 RepID=UPI001C9DB516